MIPPANEGSITFSLPPASWHKKYFTDRQRIFFLATLLLSIKTMSKIREKDILTNHASTP